MPSPQVTEWAWARTAAEMIETTRNSGVSQSEEEEEGEGASVLPPFGRMLMIDVD